MEKFYLERPSMDRKEEIIDYFNEFIKYESDIHGAGFLDKFLYGYTFEEALEVCNKLEDEEFFSSAISDSSPELLYDIASS